MAEATDMARVTAKADEYISKIIRAADSWASDVPSELTLAVRAVCVRLAEMVADQRHYLAPLPGPQEAMRTAVLTQVADRLRSGPLVEPLRANLDALAEMELRATGSWALVDSAQNEWTERAIEYLERQSRELPAEQQLDEYWADDVVAGIVASVKGIIGADDLYSRIEAQYAGKGRPRIENQD